MAPSPSVSYGAASKTHPSALSEQPSELNALGQFRRRHRHKSLRYLPADHRRLIRPWNCVDIGAALTVARRRQAAASIGG
jgi:hypothetical protein